MLSCFSETMYRSPSRQVAVYIAVEHRVLVRSGWPGCAVQSFHIRRYHRAAGRSVFATIDCHTRSRYVIAPIVDNGWQRCRGGHIRGQKLRGGKQLRRQFVHQLFVAHSLRRNFCLKGITRLLNNPLVQSYLPNSTKRLHCHQELLVFFWKICDYNKKFLYYVLKSSDVLDVLVPILYHLNDSRADQCKCSPVSLRDIFYGSIH